LFRETNVLYLPQFALARSDLDVGRFPPLSVQQVCEMLTLSLACPLGFSGHTRPAARQLLTIPVRRLSAHFEVGAFGLVEASVEGET